MKWLFFNIFFCGNYFIWLQNAPTPELERFAEKMIKDFLAPALFTCRESEKIQVGSMFID